MINLHFQILQGKNYWKLFLKNFQNVTYQLIFGKRSKCNFLKFMSCRINLSSWLFFEVEANLAETYKLSSLSLSSLSRNSARIMCVRSFFCFFLYFICTLTLQRCRRMPANRYRIDDGATKTWTHRAPFDKLTRNVCALSNSKFSIVICSFHGGSPSMRAKSNVILPHTQAHNNHSSRISSIVCM